MKYILGIDQSTQGTKAILFDEAGRMIKRADEKHAQLVNGQGWVSHNPEEIYQNVIKAVKSVVMKAGIEKEKIAAVGISNQRETTLAWDDSGRPYADAVVWQCARAETEARERSGYADIVYAKTGIPLSPYFPACKMAWLMKNCIKDASNGLHLGTVDSWLIYRLTGGAEFKTDYSNASRTQLFNLHTLSWDEELCRVFGVPLNALPAVCDSNSRFGDTDFEGFLERRIPIHAALGDSHGALYGQGCQKAGMVKATYGTGSSIMMHIGSAFKKSGHGLATSLAWGIDGTVEYVLEGNINYTGAVISWLKDDMRLIEAPGEAELLAQKAHEQDGTILVPAFTGLSAPYWRGGAKAMLYGMTRTTGRAEIVRAGLESIGYQITDVINSMEQDAEAEISELRVDGGPTKNNYLMQFQSDIAGVTVCAAENEELSAIGAAYMAGIAAGIYERERVFSNLKYRRYAPAMTSSARDEKYGAWKRAVEMVLGADAAAWLDQGKYGGVL